MWTGFQEPIVSFVFFDATVYFIAKLSDKLYKNVPDVIFRCGMDFQSVISSPINVSILSQRYPINEHKNIR